MPSKNQERLRRGRPKHRSSTQIGPLDIIESASPEAEPRQIIPLSPNATTGTQQKLGQAPQSSHARSDEFDNGVSDEELIRFDPSASLEHELMADASRRSSPAQGQIPENSWDFNPGEESEHEDPMPPTSSPKVNNLPDTVPIPTSQEIDRGAPPAFNKHGVDLSETASTAQRSPSVRESEAQGFDWGNMLPSSRATSRRHMGKQDHSSEAEDELPALEKLITTSARVEITQVPRTANARLDLESGKFASAPTKLQQDSAPDLYTDNVSEASDIGTLQQMRPPPMTDQIETVSSTNTRPVPKVNSTEARKPMPDASGVSPRKANLLRHRQSPEKKPSQEQAPGSSAGSGKKRKQWAKEPLVFDSATQAVKEGPPPKKRSPPLPKAVVKAAKKSTPATASAAASVKRPAAKAPGKPAKKPKITAPLKKSTSQDTPRRNGGRAAAQAARVAVQQQLSSSPSSNVNPAEELGFMDSIAGPIAGSVSNKLAEASEHEQDRTEPCNKEQKPSSAPKHDTQREQPKAKVISKSEKVTNRTPRYKAKDPSQQGFGGRSGRMYTATQPKQKDKMVKDSQEDTQDHILAHLAEERKAKDHVSISSDQISDSIDAMSPEPQQPKPVSKVNSLREREANDPGHLVPRGSSPSQADAALQELDDVEMADEEIPNSMAIPVVYHAPRPKQQPRTQPTLYVQPHESQEEEEMLDAMAMPGTHPESRASKQCGKPLAQQTVQVQPRERPRVPVFTEGKVLEAPVLPIHNSGKGKVTHPTLRNKKHGGANLPQLREKHAGQRDANPRRHSQRNPRPDDAFVENDDPEDRGRPLVKPSVWNRTLSVSQAGSPSRLSNDGNENLGPQSLLNVSSANSTEMKGSLGHLAENRPQQEVRRRLSYEPAPPLEAKPRQAPTRVCEPEVTETILVDETTLVDPESSSGRKADPERSHKAPSQADLSKTKSKIYDQISAADQVQEQAQKPVKVQEKLSPMKTRRADIAVQLHGVIDLVTQRLEQSEKTVAHTIHAYKDGTSRCVRRIERRLDREQMLLMKQWDSDRGRFSRSVSKAKRPIESAPETRRETVSTFERDVAQRQLLYNQANSSLRAFHSQIMRG